MEHDWLEKVDFPQHLLISVLNSSAQVYCKSQIMVEQVIKLVQNYENA
jgi:hypothetical protein